MNKKIVYIIICIILILVIIFLMKNNGGNNISNEVLAENIIEENVLNEEENIIDENTTIVENVINNVAIEESNTVQTIQNAIVQDNLISSPEKNAYESGTGLRGVKNLLLEEVDVALFNNPDIKELNIR